MLCTDRIGLGKCVGMCTGMCADLCNVHTYGYDGANRQATPRLHSLENTDAQLQAGPSLYISFYGQELMRVGTLHARRYACATGPPGARFARGKPIDICTGVCIDNRIDMCTNMCTCVCIDNRIDMCTNMCTGMCMWTCVPCMRIDRLWLFGGPPAIII